MFKRLIIKYNNFRLGRLNAKANAMFALLTDDERDNMRMGTFIHLDQYGEYSKRAPEDLRSVLEKIWRIESGKDKYIF